MTDHERKFIDLTPNATEMDKIGVELCKDLVSATEKFAALYSGKQSSHKMFTSIFNGMISYTVSTIIHLSEDFTDERKVLFDAEAQHVINMALTDARNIIDGA